MATLATSGVASSLNVPAADDTMEISSDAGRADQDLDLDFMGSEHGDADVDWMLQDAASERGSPQADANQPHNDDFMYDEGEEVTYVEEEAMQDDGHDYSEAQDEAVDLDIEFDPHPATEETLYDATQDVDLEQEQGYEEPEEETLIDFETFSEHDEDQAAEERLQQAEEVVVTYDDTAFAEQATTFEELAAPAEAVSYEAGTSWNDAGASAANADFLPEEIAPVHEGESNAEPLATEQPSEVEATSLLQSPARQDLTADADAAYQDTNSLSQHDRLLNSDVASGRADAPAPSSGVKATVHPVTVFYAFEGLEYSLFPQSEHDDPNTYLLKDTSVASSTLADLFRACRSVLDQQVNDDVELEFYIDSLHLTISEDSIHCRESSLAQIVDVYVDLMRNEGAEVIPALYMELNTKDRFSAQLTNLFKAASEKKGLYSLSIYQDEQQQQQEEEAPRQEEERVQQEQKQEEEEAPRGTSQEESFSEAQAVETDYAQAEAEPEAAQETVLATDKLLDEENGDTAKEPVEAIQARADDSFTAQPVAFDDSFEQSTARPQDSFAEETIGYQDENEEEQDPGQNKQGQDERQQDAVEDAEQGDGSSSGSSTIQGENQPESTRGYSPSLEDEEWLIDYDNEDNDFDASFEAAQAQDQFVETGGEDAAAVDEQQAQPGDFDGQLDTEESYDFTEGQTAEHYDDSAFATDTINQEFDDSIDYTVDQEYHEDDQEGLDQPGDQHEWEGDNVHHEEDTTAPTHTSGTFQVPSSTEDDEDEITFNDDEFTFDDEQTQDAAVQETTTDSPLGKRGREDEDEGAIDGGDQESKRLKAS